MLKNNDTLKSLELISTNIKLIRLACMNAQRCKKKHRNLNVEVVSSNFIGERVGNFHADWECLLRIRDFDA